MKKDRNVGERIEQKRVVADKFLTSVLIPFYKGFRDAFSIIGDLIDPLIEAYNQREGTSLEVPDLWFVVQDRIINLGEARKHGLGKRQPDSFGLTYNDYNSIKNNVEQLEHEHARAEKGVGYCGFPSWASRAEELASQARKIRKEIKDMKNRGKEELGKRQERGNGWLQRKGLSSNELLQNLLDGKISQE